MSAIDASKDATILDYECDECGFKWIDVMREEYGQCDDDCPRCGARHMSPTEREMPSHEDATLLQAMLTACQSLDSAYANGAESGSIDWSELDDAARLARVAIGLAELKGFVSTPQRRVRG